MADIVDRATRSRMMSGIRSRDTRPERVIRSLLHRSGFRFRLHPTNIPGRPDIALPKYRAAIHIHGCFWHGHDCSLFRMPATRKQFWKDKIGRNRARDDQVIAATLEIGWRHLTVWECAFRGPDQLGLGKTGNRICKWIKSRNRQGTIRS
ncbi:MAG: DNA mismatch endonuclease Vsr [Burkholderiales bacterium]